MLITNYVYSIPHQRIGQQQHAQVNTPVVEEGLVCGLLQKLNPHKFVSLNRIHPRVQEKWLILLQGIVAYNI